jgi:hypothetical protein
MTGTCSVEREYDVSIKKFVLANLRGRTDVSVQAL